MSNSIINTPINVPIVHESAALHVTGRAVYVDDMPLPANSVHIALGLSHVSHGKLNSIVFDEALPLLGSWLSSVRLIFLAKMIVVP